MHTLDLRRRGALTYYILQLGSCAGHTWCATPRRSNVVYLTEFKISESVARGGDCPLLLPKNVEILAIRRCYINVSNLCELASSISATSVKRCYINDCRKIEHLLSYSSNTIRLVQRLEELNLEAVWGLRGLIRMEGGSPSIPPSSSIFLSLKKLSIGHCNNVKRLFNIAPPPNLENLSVFQCKQLVEIISTRYDDDNDDEENQSEERGSISGHAIIVTLPKLQYLNLSSLPELLSIPVVSDSLQQIDIWTCPKLKRIPPVDTEPFPPSFRSVYIGKDVWESLEWDYPNAKNVSKSLMPRCL